MEKFGLLNLLKAIDGLNAADKQADGVQPPAKNSPPEEEPPQNRLPNVVYEKLLVHEAMSNRLKNKKK